MNTKLLLFLGCAVVLMAVIRGQDEETPEALNQKAINASKTAIGLNNTAASQYAAANAAVQQAQTAVDNCEKKADAENNDGDSKGPLVLAKDALEAAGIALDAVITQAQAASDKAKEAKAQFELITNANGADTAGMKEKLKIAAGEAETAKNEVVKVAGTVTEKNQTITENIPKVYELCPTTTSTTTTSPTTTTTKKAGGNAGNGNNSVINGSTTTPGANLSGSTTTPGANLNGSTTTLAGNGSSNSSDRADSYGGEAVTANKWLMLCSTAALLALANFAF